MGNFFINRALALLASGGLSSFTALYLSPRRAIIAMQRLSRFTKKPGAIWKALVILFTLVNLKVLPLVWHYRLFKGLLTHVSLRKNFCPPSPGPSALFQPIITSTRNTILEMDYNLHKSNSTYFSDLDVSRMNHVACLFKRGLHKAHFTPPRNPDGTKRGRLGVMLGGVTCTFKKEIKPMEKYEIWTRLLSWDRKWIYLVSHIVKAGTVRPRGFTLQPHVSAEKSQANVNGFHGNEMANGGLINLDEDPSSFGKDINPPHATIFASSLSKYVFKHGRKTIPPEQVLDFSELLPPRPDNSSEIVGNEITYAGFPASSKASRFGVEPYDGEDIWDWDRVEQERARGMIVAQNMANLDDLHWEFTADKTPALGRY